MATQTLQMRPLFEPVVDRYDSPGQGDYAMGLKTYRYLRLSMIIVMVALGASVLLVRRKHTFFEQSISAYYYTSAHSVFVGALVATGVALTVIKGRTTLEDWMLSIAGVFAPVIAFVPTTSLHANALSADALAAARNDVAALLVAGWVAWVVVASVTAFARGDRARTPQVDEWRRWSSVAGMFLLLTAATIFYLGWWTSFATHAHGWSAAAMFAALGAAALVNGLGHHVSPRIGSTHATSYLIVGILMWGVGIGFLVTSIGHLQWSHEVLEVEAVEIFLFVVFWAIQSRERWYWTVAPPASTEPDEHAAHPDPDDFIDLHAMNPPTQGSHEVARP